MRNKENAKDYRYFPDPDLLTVEISKEDVERIKATIPELPKDRENRYVQKLGLPVYDAKILTNEKFISDYFDECLSKLDDAKQLSNWIMTDILKILKDKENCDDLNEIITSDNLVEIIKLLKDKEISRTNSKELFEKLIGSKEQAKNVAEKMGYLVKFSDEEILKAISDAISTFPNALNDDEKTPDKVIKFYIGKVMQLSKGLANPTKSENFIKSKIEEIKNK